MANLLKQQRNELLSKAFDENPELAKGKKLCGILALLWIFFRALHLIVELILAFTVDFSIFSITNIAALVIVIMFSIGIYNGGKAFAILPILGGALMTLQIFTAQVYVMLGAEYMVETHTIANKVEYILWLLWRIGIPLRYEPTSKTQSRKAKAYESNS